MINWKQSAHSRRGFASLCLAALLTLGAGIADAGTKPLPPQSRAFGNSYAEYALLWLQWAMSIPASSNPILDTDGTFAAVGQSGKVWFLAGNFGGATERSITIASGTPLFFPIVNIFWNNTPEYGDAPWSAEQEAYARSVIGAVVDTAQNLVLEIDGRPVRNIYNYRVASPAGLCNIPLTDNILGAPLQPIPHECVADGYWALLPPMSVGEHTIRFAGGFSANGFSLDVTYHITVRPRQKVVVGANPLSAHP